MLDRRFIRENPDTVRRAIEVKGIDLDLDRLLSVDEETRHLQRQVDDNLATKKSLSREFSKVDESKQAELRNRSKQVDDSLKNLQEELRAAKAELHDLLLRTPTVPWDGSPIGPDESDNTVVRVVGAPPEFDFEPLDHVDLAEQRGWAEFERARKASGSRAYALVGDLLLLERALHSYALDLLQQRDFRVISVPSIVREAPLVGSGMFPTARTETYALTADEMYLAGTAEVALVGLHSDEILNVDDLPLLYAGISPCFRREIGSASRDVRGLLRVHQFEKVEQFVLCEADADESARWHANLLTTAEDILQRLGLHYEVVECATGDMGTGKFRMNDVNTWFPSLGMMRETHSCSTLHEWQARRANLRYRDGNGKVRFVHTLNNTAVATPRLLAALIENKQTSNREVIVPEVLRPYLGGRDTL